MVFRDYPIITRYSISTTDLAPRENHSAHNYISKLPNSAIYSTIVE